LRLQLRDAQSSAGANAYAGSFPVPALLSACYFAAAVSISLMFSEC